MCGITALLDVRGRPVDPGALHRATEILAHRGPDDEGYLITGPGSGERHLGGAVTKVEGLARIETAAPIEGQTIGLGNRRLAILDPTPAGHAPMQSANGRFWIAYNGEIYNYRELARDLEAQGARFHTGTDTEVVLAAYSAWGDRCFERFNGMFALALWDSERAQLVLARDRLGIKPLYAARIGTLFIAASEIKALLSLGASRAIDWEMAYGYLVGGLSDWGGGTFFDAIRQVEPGTVETISPSGEVLRTRYWSLENVRPFAGDRADAARRFRELFLDSVRLQLRSDVPVGTCLSGGLDSSSIAGAVAVERGERVVQHAFSCQFPGTSVDESGYARDVATMTGLQMHEVTPRTDEFAAELDMLVLAQDEPFPGSSMYAQWRVMKLAAQNRVPVLLDGQGGDEILAGYAGFRPLAAADLLRRGRLVRAAGEIWAVRDQMALTSATARMLAAAAPAAARQRARERTRRRAASFVSPELHRLAEPALATLERHNGGLEDGLRHALLNTSVPVLLRSEDRNSMAHSIEARVPFLDHRLVEFASSLPGEFKLHRGRTKVILRDALADLLPASVSARRDKIGFATPEASWLLGPIRATVDQTLSELPADGVIDMTRARAIWARAQRGDAGAIPYVWRMFCFERWRSLMRAD